MKDSKNVPSIQMSDEDCEFSQCPRTPVAAIRGKRKRRTSDIIDCMGEDAVMGTPEKPSASTPATMMMMREFKTPINRIISTTDEVGNNVPVL